MKTVIACFVILVSGCASVVPSATRPGDTGPVVGQSTIADVVAMNVARKHYGSAATQKSVTTRKAILVTFERSKAWGELRFLLLQMPAPQNLRIVALQEAAGNYPDALRFPSEDSALFFSDESFRKLKQYGRSWCGDVFASVSPGEKELPRILLPTIARRCLKDGGDFGREREWKEAFFRIEPLFVSEHEFATNARSTLGANVFSCSVFLDESGAVVCHTNNGVFHVD